MFHRIGRVVVRHPVWTIVAWIFAAVAIVATAPSLPSSSDQSSFLPKSYESIQAADLQQRRSRAPSRRPRSCCTSVPTAAS